MANDGVKTWRTLLLYRDLQKYFAAQLFNLSLVSFALCWAPPYIEVLLSRAVSPIICGLQHLDGRMIGKSVTCNRGSLPG